VRCFVAIELPDAVRAALGVAQGRLRAAASQADVRWVDPSAMHLTLQFLGAVPDERVESVGRALAAAVGPHAPIPLACVGLGVFPGPARPRVFWAGVTGGLGALGRLVLAIGQEMEPVGFPPERRPFAAHVTLGRARSSRGASRLVSALADTSAAFGAWTVTEAVLFRSHLRPTGARYEALARLPLAGGLLADGT